VPLLPKDLTDMSALVARFNAHHLAQLPVTVA
jgi:hypothetical protein